MDNERELREPESLARKIVRAVYNAHEATLDHVEHARFEQAISRVEKILTAAPAPIMKAINRLKLVASNASLATLPGLNRAIEELKELSALAGEIDNHGDVK